MIDLNLQAHEESVMAMQKNVRETVDRLCNALLQDEQIISSAERVLLTDIIRFTKKQSSSSAELESVISGRISSAIASALAQRLFTTLGDTIVQRLLGSDPQALGDLAVDDYLLQEPHHLTKNGEQPTGHPMNEPGHPMNEPGHPMNEPGQPMKEIAKPMGHPMNEPHSRYSTLPVQGLNASAQNGLESYKYQAKHGEQVLVFEEFLVKDELSALTEYVLDSEKKFKASEVIGPATGTGRVDFAHRCSRVLFDLAQHRGVVAERILFHLPKIFERLQYPPFEIMDVEAQITASNDGDFFAKHNDGTHIAVRSRALTFVYFFHREPAAFTGGELRIYDAQYLDGRYVVQKTFRSIVPEQNQIVFFPSHLIHEILLVHCPSKAFADSRFTLNGWLHR